MTLFMIHANILINLISTRIMILSIICLTSSNAPSDILTADSKNSRKFSNLEIRFKSLKNESLTLWIINLIYHFYLPLVSSKTKWFFSIFLVSLVSLACFCFSIIILLSSSATFLCLSFVHNKHGFLKWQKITITSLTFDINYLMRIKLDLVN